ncbi:MAG: DUF952 domain-containing protein [Deltaproteobacteria bacterium]|nr:DUF952 domain-containing protein [Deltaproteobacteria bacterium]
MVSPAQWATLQQQRAWAGAPVDLADGFVHLSAADQVEGTLARHFTGQGPLLLLRVAPARLPPGALVWEVSRGSALFPHLYAPLPHAAVVEMQPLPVDPDGGHPLSGGLPDQIDAQGAGSTTTSGAEAALLVAEGGAELLPEGLDGLANIGEVIGAVAELGGELLGAVAEGLSGIDL